MTSRTRSTLCVTGIVALSFCSSFCVSAGAQPSRNARLESSSVRENRSESLNKRKQKRYKKTIKKPAGIGENRSESFPVRPGGALDVSSGEGAIFVTVHDKDEVTVTAKGVDRDDLDRLDMIQHGNTVRVDFHPGIRPGWRRWSSRIRFEIEVPAHFNLDLRTGGGDIEVAGALRGDVQGHTSGGDITLDDVDGEVDMSTSGGDIRTGKITGEGHLKTSGGDIRVDKSIAALDVQTSGGDIKLGSVGGRLEAKTSGGDITLGDVGGRARLTTSGGDIKVGRVSGGAILTTAGGMIELRGASGEVRARTAGGDLELENVTGSVEAETAGGDIFAELIPKGAGRSSLTTAAGNIVLYIPAKAKATIEARIRVRDFWRVRRGRTRRDEGRRSKYEVRSDFKADQYDEREEDVHAIYTLNGGGERIWLETTNGDISIRTLTAKR